MMLDQYKDDEKSHFIKMIEAILFASPQPVQVQELSEILKVEDLSLKTIQQYVDELVSFYENRQGGFLLLYIKGEGYQFQTRPDASEYLVRVFARRPRPLSRAAQETLAIIAYRQPVTRADIEFIRGTDVGGILKNLLDRNLVRCIGRKEDLGKPMLFATTSEFLNVFGLKDLKALPPLESFQPSLEKMQKAMSDIDEMGTEPVDIPNLIGHNDGTTTQNEITKH